MKNAMLKRRRAPKTQLPNLPGDIVVDILRMLPAKSICRFKCVCKHWYTLFKDPDFINNRLKLSILTENLKIFLIKNVYNRKETEFSTLYAVFENNRCEYVRRMDCSIKTTRERMDIVGYCNGLILMKDYISHSTGWYGLWNPYTKEYKEIGIPKVEYGPGDYIRRYSIASVTCGICYNRDTNGYKIVVAICYQNSYFWKTTDGCKILVYTSESSSWKTLPNIFPYWISNGTCMTQVIFVCGAFHWIASRLRPSFQDCTRPSFTKCIVSYDVDREKFKEVGVTHRLLNDGNRHDLDVLGGCLCIIRRTSCNSNIKGFEVWVKKDYNVTRSWTKLFVVELPIIGNVISFVKILWEFKNGQVLFVQTNGSDRRLVLYDPVSKKCQVTGIQYIDGREWNIEAYVERGLVSHNSKYGNSNMLYTPRSRKLLGYLRRQLKKFG